MNFHAPGPAKGDSTHTVTTNVIAKQQVAVLGIELKQIKTMLSDA